MINSDTLHVLCIYLDSTPISHHQRLLLSSLIPVFLPCIGNTEQAQCTKCLVCVVANLLQKKKNYVKDSHGVCHENAEISQ